MLYNYQESALPRLRSSQRITSSIQLKGEWLPFNILISVRDFADWIKDDIIGPGGVRACFLTRMEERKDWNRLKAQQRRNEQF